MSQPTDASQQAGPIRVPTAHGYTVVAWVDRPFTDGFEVLNAPGARGDIVVTSVDLIDADGLELVGSLVSPNDEGLGIVASYPRFPPRDPTLDRVEELIGTPLDPRPVSVPGQQLLIGMKASQSGVHKRKGIRLAYMVNGESYVVDLPAEVTVCVLRQGQRAQRARTMDGCPMSDGAGS